MHNAGTQSAPAETTTGPIASGGRQPAWMTLDEARERAFTGELVFEVDPEVHAYLDNGVVYYAERAAGAPLGRRLVEAGVLDPEQLERGTVRVGDVAHLGRLFDRDVTIDRDAVMVVTEMATEDVIADLANHAVTTVRATAYRHHPSGVHRWFVSTAEHMSRAVGPELTPGPVMLSPELDGADALTIEWDRFDEDTLEGATLPDFERFELVMFDPFREAGDQDGTEGSVPAEAAATPVTDDLADFEFELAWPDGTHEAVPMEEVDPAAPVAEEPAPFTETVDGEFRFEMPPVVLADDELTADEVPDDVAAAVRRAIAAIEAAAVAPVAASVDIDTHPELPVDAGPTIAERALAGEPITTPMPVQPAGPINAFAPPTLDMSADAVYARMEAELEAQGYTADSDADVAAAAIPATGVVESPVLSQTAEQSVAPVASGSGDDRTSALRRLIGGLRRKDR